MQRELMQKRASDIQGMFGRIAHRYDLLNRMLSLGQDQRWRRCLARRVAALAPERVLDVCSGTGDVALALEPGPVIVAADFSLAMVGLARRKSVSRRRRLALAVADALALPIANGAVDVVTVAFGVRNFEHLGSGLAELCRVLRPGGALLILEFSRPTGFLSPALVWWTRTVPPRVGRLVSGDPDAYRYLPESVAAFADVQTMCRLLAGLGFEYVTADALTGGVCTLYQGFRPLDGEGGRADG